MSSHMERWRRRRWVTSVIGLTIVTISGRIVRGACRTIAVRVPLTNIARVMSHWMAAKSFRYGITIRHISIHMVLDARYAHSLWPGDVWKHDAFDWTGFGKPVTP